MFLLWAGGRTGVLTLRGGMEAWRDMFPADSLKRGDEMKQGTNVATPSREREKSRDEC